MSSLANKDWPAVLATMAGIAVMAMPLEFPWGPLPLVAAAMAGIAECKGVWSRWLLAGASVALLALVLVGIADVPLATSIAAAGVLAMRSSSAPLAIAILLMQSSVAASLVALLSDQMAPLGLEAAAPAVMTTLCLWLARPHAIVLVTGSIAASLCLGWLGNRIATTPDMVMAVAGLAPLPLGAGLAILEKEGRGRWIASIGAMALVAATWALTPPQSSHGVFVFLPNAPKVFAAKFFANYADALTFGGVAATLVDNPETIPEGALLLLPWLTEPLSSGDERDIRIGELARARRWTVLIGGEHTDLGGVAARIERITGRALLHRDLSVPPSNTDNTGPMRAADVRAWPHNAILNRGATVVISSILDRVLLAGDGWWAESDIGEWLWAGDYIWSHGDRAGRLTIAAAFSDGQARWVVAGDNSVFVNGQLVADPRPVLRLIEMATLWPAFARDILVLAVAGFMLMPLRWSLVPVGSVVVAALLAHAMSSKASERWADLYRGENGFDERNFNEALLLEPRLLRADGWRLLRYAMLDDDFHPPPGNSIVFGFVDDYARIGTVRLSDCRRLGNLTTAEGPLLMDAQSCRVEGGETKVLLGSPRSAAAILIHHDLGTTIVILDAAFLGRKAPAANREWIIRMMGSR